MRVAGKLKCRSEAKALRDLVLQGFIEALHFRLTITVPGFRVEAGCRLSAFPWDPNTPTTSHVSPFFQQKILDDTSHVVLMQDSA